VVVDHLGKRFEGDLGILAVGALRSGLVGSHLKAPRCAGVLKMLSIARIDGELPTAIADADSMRHYPAYRSARLEGLPPRSAGRAPPDPACARAAGRRDFDIGDTHRTTSHSTSPSRRSSRCAARTDPSNPGRAARAGRLPVHR
jgi:hypothetical protein